MTTTRTALTALAFVCLAACSGGSKASATPEEKVLVKIHSAYPALDKSKATDATLLATTHLTCKMLATEIAGARIYPTADSFAARTAVENPGFSAEKVAKINRIESIGIDQFCPELR